MADLRATALAPLVRPLPVTDRGADDRWIRADLDVDLRLIVGIAGMERDEMMRIARRWTGGAAVATSRSATAGCRGMLVATGGRVGLDVETLGRIADNTTPQDGWLAADERRLVTAAAEPILELACHWVLKEAYGKALGVGLALPLDRLAFGAKADLVVLDGDAAPAPRTGWSFALYRRDVTLFGIARQAQFAPVGMKPPAPLLER